ncbi:hypothetical protein [Nocardia abscessus]|uniref:hypothetical protein n=1 Tax=Nocardia abscessus TaxID=120957 RepID=UPI00146157EF|nr:hypothetical protein [Nocardia abscessus]MCC3328335.1 hypothetical protein [Nocardia abscessus]
MNTTAVESLSRLMKSGVNEAGEALVQVVRRSKLLAVLGVSLALLHEGGGGEQFEQGRGSR